MTPQQQSRNNGGEPVTMPDGSAYRRGVKVSAGDRANTERTYAENAAHAARGGKNPDRSRDPKAEGKLAQARYEANPGRYMAQGWDGQPLAPVAKAAGSGDQVEAPALRPSQGGGLVTPDAPILTNYFSPPASFAPQFEPSAAPRVEPLPSMVQMVADGGLVLPRGVVVPPNYEFLTQRAPSPAEANRAAVDATLARALGRVPQKPTSGGTITRNGVVTEVPPSFAGGGYTGPGPKMQPAGIVHAGEFVIPKEKVAEIGVPALDAYFGTDSTKPKYGFVGGGAPTIDLSGVKLPKGQKIPPQVRLAAEELFRLGGRSNQEIVNALSRGNFDDIVAEAGKYKTQFKQDEAAKAVQEAQKKFNTLYETRVGEITSQQKDLANSLTAARSAYEQSMADIEPAVRTKLKETLRAQANVEGGLARLNAPTTYKTTDENGQEKLQEVPGLGLNLVGDPETDDRQLSNAVDKIMLGSNHPEIKAVSANAVKAVAPARAAAIQSSKSQIDSITEQMKLLGRSRESLARDPQLVQAQETLGAAQKLATQLGPRVPSAVDAQTAAASRISEEESRATSFAGGPGAYFSPYVVDPNTGLPKKFATLDEARAAATGKAPAAAASLAEFMAPTQPGVFAPGEPMFPGAPAPVAPPAPAPAAVMDEADFNDWNNRADARDAALSQAAQAPAPSAPRTYADVAAALTPVVPSAGATPDTSENYGQRNLDSLAATWRQISRPFTQELTPKDPILDRISALDYQMGAYSDRSSPRYQALVAERNQLMASRSAPKQESPIEGPTPEFFGPQESPILPSGPADVGSAAGRGFGQGPYQSPVISAPEYFSGGLVKKIRMR